MARNRHQRQQQQQEEGVAAQIYEDPEPVAKAKSKTHSRGPSAVGDMFRGRRKHVSADTQQSQCHSPSPLGERHVNSPPPSSGVRVPLRQEDDRRRPSTHKRTGSSVSLRELIMGGAARDGAAAAESKAAQKSPKKVKSSTNLAGLLKKRKKSRADLREDETGSRDQENVSPSKKEATAGGGGSKGLLWDQMATQPIRDADGFVNYPQGGGGGGQQRTVEEEIALYTPKDYSEYRPHEQRNFYDCTAPPMGFAPPRRPCLEHKGSRGSIFTENINDDEPPALQRPKSRDHNQSTTMSTTTAAAPTLSSRIAEMRSKFEGASAASPAAAAAAAEPKERSRSRVLEAFSTFGGRSKESGVSTSPKNEQALTAEQLDSAFEAVLDARNIPHNMRDTMRSLKPELKLALMRGDRSGSESSSTMSVQLNDVGQQRGRSPTKREERPKSQEGDGRGTRSKSRPRSGILTLSRKDNGSSSPTKPDKGTPRSRSKSRPKSVDLSALRPSTSRSVTSSSSVTSLATVESAATPGDFIHYFQEVQKPSLIELGKLHKLRILLRNESVSWTDHFVRKGGMDELVSLLYRITRIEWREEHHDNLLHETLLCLKALCTTELALQKLAEIEDDFFPTVLSMLFDPERKGPSEFSTRGVIVSLLFAHLSAALQQNGGSEQLEHRARKILRFLQDPTPDRERDLVDFVSQMHTARPYRVWCKEVVNVTKDVFWIFLHHLNVVPVVGGSNGGDEQSNYAQAHFPTPRPPHPAAPYVGGVEWEATQYIALHLDLLNGLIACIRGVDERNRLREHLRQSGWERVMGGSLRTCKEKFYAGVHDGLRVWVGAARADGWPAEDVRAGPPRDASPRKRSPAKAGAGKVEAPPQISLDVGGGVGGGGGGAGALTQVDDSWLQA